MGGRAIVRIFRRVLNLPKLTEDRDNGRLITLIIEGEFAQPDPHLGGLS
jgi:hypothetical protein